MTTPVESLDARLAKIGFKPLREQGIQADQQEKNIQQQPQTQGIPNNQRIGMQQPEESIEDRLGKIGFKQEISPFLKYPGMGASAALEYTAGIPGDLLTMLTSISGTDVPFEDPETQEELDINKHVLENQDKYRKPAAEILSNLGSRGIEKAIDFATFDYLKPRTPVEKAYKKAVGFFASNATFGKLMGQGMFPGGLKTEIVGSAAAGAASQALEEEGPIKNILGTAGADVIARMIVNRDFRKGVAGTVLGLFSKGVDQEAVKNAQKLGLEVPASVIKPDSWTNAFEQRLAEFPGSKRVYEEAAEKANKQTLDMLENTNAQKFSDIATGKEEIGKSVQE